MKENERYLVIEPFTGEEIGYTTPKKVKRFDTYYKFNADKSFVKFFVAERCKELLQRATKPELWLFGAVEKYLSPHDNALREGGHPNGKLLDSHDLEKALGIKYDNLRRSLTGLREKSLLDEFRLQDGKAIILNPDIVQRGENLNPEIYKHFNTRNTDSHFVKVFESGISLTNGEAWLSMILRFHVSYNDGVLRYGGHGNGSALTMTDLPELVGESYDNIRKLVSGLKRKRILCGFTQNSTQEKVIAMNPSVCMKGLNMKWETVLRFDPERAKTVTNTQILDYII